MALPGLPTVEIAIGADPDDPSTWLTWTDITSYVRHDSGIAITGGRRDEGAQADAGTCRLVLDNRDGRFSPRNPLGAYYPDLARNTPLRVTWTLAGDLFIGYVSEWPPRFDQSGNEANVPIQADGWLRRGRQGRDAFRSPLYRHIMGQSELPLAYWPLEDPSTTTTATSAVNVPPLRSFVDENGLLPASGDTAPSFGDTAMPIGSDASVRIVSGMGLSSIVPPPDGSPMAWSFEVWVDFLDIDDFNARLLVGMAAPGAATAQSYELDVRPDRFQFEGKSESGGIISVLNASDDPGAGLHHIVVTAVSGVSSTHGYVDGVEVDSGTTNPVNPINSFELINGSLTDGDLLVSHAVVWNRELSAQEIADRYQAGLAFVGELASDRITRLCSEESVPISIVGTAADTVEMGQQRSGQMLELIQECETADGGMLAEADGGLAYRTRTDLYNQTAALDLSVAASQLAQPPEPVDDDKTLRNIITVMNLTGEQYTTRAVGIEGEYPDTVNVNIANGDEVGNIAGWQLNLGTVDEYRYPSLSIDLARNPGLIADWLALMATISPRLTIQHEIPQLLGGPIDVLVTGWSQVLSSVEWRVELSCVPASPWRIAVLDDADLARLDTGGSELAAAIDSDDTSISVSTTAGPRWVDSTNYADQFPFDVMIGGERMTVTAVSGTSSPQTFTVTRAVNDIVKSHAIATAVRIANPVVLAL